MMVNCPKCGFAQPKDQFCAKCGVDMLAFRPPEVPLSKKLMSNWIFQIAVFALIILAVYTVIRDRSRANLEDRVADIDSAPQSMAQQTSESSSTGFGSSSTTSAANASPSGMQPSQVQPQADGQNRLAQSGANNSAGFAGNAGGTQSAPPPAEQGAAGLNRAADQVLGERGAQTLVRSLRVSFSEAQRGLIGEINRNTVNLASYGANFSGGVVNDLTEKMNEYARSMRPLDVAFDYPVQLNQPIVVFKGARDEELGNVGITVQITATANDENGVQLQVEVLRALRDQNGQLSEQNFQDNFLVPREGGAYMAGLFNRRTLTDPERAFYSNASVLKILASPNFINQQTDFLMMIHAK